MGKKVIFHKIKQKTNYVWRVGATGFSFASFGVGGMLIGGVIAPIINALTPEQKQKHFRAQQVIRYSFKGFTEMMVKLGIMTYEVEGLEKLQHSQQELIIANHPTLIDVVVLIGQMTKANCVVKQALWSNPFTKGPVKNAGYILNTGSAQFVEDCVNSLQENGAASLVIFPEGTRTEKGEMLNEFQRGAANIALRAKVPIRPVLISCTPSTLTKNEKWYHIPPQHFHIKVNVLDAIDINDILEDTTVSPKHVRQLNKQLEQFFHQALLDQELFKNEQSC
jgi:1-acyl-sn-glycerol-3-phosphate acyltransferase